MLKIIGRTHNYKHTVLIVYSHHLAAVKEMFSPNLQYFSLLSHSLYSHFVSQHVKLHGVKKKSDWSYVVMKSYRNPATFRVNGCLSNLITFLEFNVQSESCICV